MKLKQITFLVPFILLVGIMSLRVTAQNTFEELSLKVFDQFQKIKPRVYQDAGVSFIDIDDESLKRLGQWPWPRTQVAALVNKLSSSGSAVITFDIVFAESDRTSPKNISKIWEQAHSFDFSKDALNNLPDHDTVLTNAIKKTNVVTGFHLTSQTNPAVPIKKTGTAFSGNNPIDSLPNFRGAITNLTTFEENASGNGSFAYLAESDGILRRIPLILRLEDKIYPSLVAESIRVAQSASTIIIKSAGGSGESSFGEQTGIVSVKIGQLIIPTDSRGRIWLYDTGKVASRSIPAWEVFEKNFNPARVKDRIVILGSSAGGLKDIRATPLNPVAAGPEVHVQLLEQILTQEFLRRPDWAVGAELIFLFILGLSLIILLPHMGALACALIGLLSVAGAIYTSWYLFSIKHLLIDPVFACLAALVIYLAVSLLNYLKTESEKKHVRDAFSRYVSPSFVKELANHPERLKLGGETREMTILFSDIRSFTTFSERMNASELTRFMNRYLTPMTDIILKHGGTIDKYIGDCIMAFWNAPIDDPKHAHNACLAAADMLSGLRHLNEQLHAEATEKSGVFFPIQIGIGINTGSCSVGNMGSSQRFDYSVLGDSVNLASRLESLSKLYGLDLLIGENTFSAAKLDNALEIDLIKVKGKHLPSKIYTFFNLQTAESRSCFENLKVKHQEMLTAYRNQSWVTAERLARECMDRKYDLVSLRNIYQTYLTRIESFKSNPPEHSWDGVWEALTK